MTLVAASILLPARPLSTHAEPARGGTAGGAPTAPVPAPSEDEALQRRIAAILSSAGVPGAGVAIVDGRGARVFGVGIADPATGRPVTPETLFRVGSVTKSVTALAVLRLAEEGRVSLDGSVRALLPGVAFENPWEAERPLRVEHLLEHTAGWEFLRYVEEWEDAEAPRPLAEILARTPGSRRCRYPPGTYAGYSNEGYLVAGRLIEQIAGLPFDDAVRRLVLEPLGMTDTAFQLDPARAARLAAGVRAGRAVPYREDGIRPAAGMLTSPRDLARWLELWVGRGADGKGLVPASAIARAEEARTLLGPGPALRYGLGNAGDEIAGVAVRGHAGFTHGYTASFRYAPREGFGFAVLLNGESAPALAAVEAELARAVSAGAPAPSGAASEAPADPAALARVAGWYEEVTPPREIWAPLTAVGGRELAVRDGRLAMRSLDPARPMDLVRPGRWTPLSPRGDGGFAPPGRTLSSLRFVERDGGMLLLEELGAWRRASAGRAAAARGGLTAALGLLATTLLAAPALLLWARTAGAPAPHALPLAALAALALAGGWYLVSHGSGHLAAPGPVSLGVCAASIAFVAAALASAIAAALDLRRGLPPALLGYQAAVAGAALALAVWAYRAGWFPLRTWRG